MDYEKKMKNLLNEVKQRRQYKKLPTEFRVLAYIGTVPFWITAIFSIAMYFIASFFYNMLSSGVDYLEEWLKRSKSDVRHLTEAVLYLIAMPAIFFVQIFLSFIAFFFFIIWFCLQCSLYIATLGSIKWQPYINQASCDKNDYTVTTNLTASKVFAIISSVLFGIVALFYILARIALVVNVNIYDILYFIYILFTAIATPLIFTKEFNTDEPNACDEPVCSDNVAKESTVKEATEV